MSALSSNYTLYFCMRADFIFYHQAIGEKAEDEAGIDGRNIDAMMKELNISRNQAVRALRRTNGDLIDALLNGGE